MSGGNFRGGAGIKGGVGYIALSGFEGASWVYGKAEGGKFGRVERRNVHRGCTGNAEEQLPVASRQLSVVSCQLWSGGPLASLRGTAEAAVLT